MNKNVAENITHNEYKDVLFNPKYLKHSMNRIQNKNHRLGTYKNQQNFFVLVWW